MPHQLGKQEVYFGLESNLKLSSIQFSQQPVQSVKKVLEKECLMYQFSSVQLCLSDIKIYRIVKKFDKERKQL